MNVGARRVRALTDHNIKPEFIQKVIRQETAREAEVCATMAQKRPQVKNTHLIEYCCGPESLLMKRWCQLGGKGTRVSFPEMDASSPNIVDKIVS